MRQVVRRARGKMRRDGVVPPAGLGGAVNDAAAPGGRGEGSAVMAVERHVALVRIKVGDHAQQQALPRTRRSGDGDALAGGDGKVERTRKGAAQARQTEARRLVPHPWRPVPLLWRLAPLLR